MSARHASEPDAAAGFEGARLAIYRRVLWTVLVINGVMFLIEGASGLAANSVSLQADALDFLGDAATYAISLMVLGMSVRWRASAAILKGAAMGAFGVWILGASVFHVIFPALPSAGVMGGVGVTASDRETLQAAIADGMNADTFTLIACPIGRKAYDGRF